MHNMEKSRREVNGAVVYGNGPYMRPTYRAYEPHGDRSAGVGGPTFVFPGQPGPGFGHMGYPAQRVPIGRSQPVGRVTTDTKYARNTNVISPTNTIKEINKFNEMLYMPNLRDSKEAPLYQYHFSHHKEVSHVPKRITISNPSLYHPSVKDSYNRGGVEDKQSVPLSGNLNSQHPINDHKNSTSSRHFTVVKNYPSQNLKTSRSAVGPSIENRDPAGVAVYNVQSEIGRMVGPGQNKEAMVDVRVRGDYYREDGGGPDVVSKTRYLYVKHKLDKAKESEEALLENISYRQHILSNAIHKDNFDKDNIAPDQQRVTTVCSVGTKQLKSNHCTRVISEAESSNFLGQVEDAFPSEATGYLPREGPYDQSGQESVKHGRTRNSLDEPKSLKLKLSPRESRREEKPNCLDRANKDEGSILETHERSSVEKDSKRSSVEKDRVTSIRNSLDGLYTSGDRINGSRDGVMSPQGGDTKNVFSESPCFPDFDDEKQEAKKKKKKKKKKRKTKSTRTTFM